MSQGERINRLIYLLMTLRKHLTRCWCLKQGGEHTKVCLEIQNTVLGETDEINGADFQ
jgi:hypothetical protein